LNSRWVFALASGAWWNQIALQWDLPIALAFEPLFGAHLCQVISAVANGAPGSQIVWTAIMGDVIEVGSGQ